MNKKSFYQLTLAATALSVAGYIIAAVAFTPSAQPVGSLAQLEITNFDLTGDNEIVFKIDYLREKWSGNVYAYPVSKDGVINTPAEWWSGGAATHLDNQDFDAERKVVTLKSDGTKIPFRYASLSTTQQALLGSTVTARQNVLNYVRGQRTNEIANGGTLRDRAHVLGDILHSRPYYMPNNGEPVLFVGANDGLLHVIDARGALGGDELWAYMPSMLMANLPKLTVNPYVHEYFVDGGLNVSEVVISGVTKKVLVSGLGAGGRGLFALDVTNPIVASETDAASKILWEISNVSTGYSNLGYTYSTPTIGKVNSNSGEPAVIIGNGYNSGGASSLFVINATTGGIIREISTSGSTGGGLSTPTCVDTNSDTRIDICYAGDIDGKLWKFNMASATSSTWAATLMYTTNPVQAITMAPATVSHPLGGNMVNFATGKMLIATDETDVSTHYAYGIWDPAISIPNAAILSQTLVQKTYVNGSTSIPVRVSSTNNKPVWTSGAANHIGWRVALPSAGERVIGDGAFVENGRFYFNSTNPTVINPSPRPIGENWLMEMDALTGGVVNSPFLDLNGDQLLNNSDRTRFVTGDALPPGAALGDVNTTYSGVALGRLVTEGVGSQPILVQLSSLNTTFTNQNPNVILPVTTTDRGVAGGHFDVDIYYPTYDGTTKKHFHEYDDIFNVTGVNMLNASDTSLNLSNAITNTGTSFKVLVHNQYLNPGVTLAVGNNPYVSVKLYGDQAKELVATNVINNAPVYTRATANFQFEFNMPVDTFTPKDWWANAGGSGFVAGNTRVGLQPTQTACVNREKIPKGGTFTTYYNPVVPPANNVTSGGSTSSMPGARHNGALTIQVVKSNTTAAQIELNVPSRPEYGWRLKNTSHNAQLLAEYTVFWHHPNGSCYDDSSWTSNPPKDLDPSDPLKYRVPVAGSDDPSDGSFRATGTVVNVQTEVSGNLTTIVTNYSDGTAQQVSITKNNDGTTTTVTVNPDGTTKTVVTASPDGSTGTGGDEKRNQARTGRVSWSELLRN